MTPWLAAIDFEVLIWGILAVVYILAQIISQFTKKPGDKSGGSPWREAPQEIREFLEEIRENAQGEVEEEEWTPPPPQRPAPPPIRSRTAPRQQQAPAPARRSATPAYKSSVNKIDAALERRRHQFRCQIQKQAEKLNKRRQGRPTHGTSLVGEAPAELPQESSMAYLSAGLQGFKLPSLGLPTASSSLQKQTIQHSLSLNSPDKLREALILSIVLGPPICENPPGYKNVMTQV